MKYKLTKLDNGLRVLLVPMPSTQTVTVMTLVEAGSKYETKPQNGISHFLEHTVFKGTTKRPTAMHITRELDAMGVQYNAFTSQEYTGYYAKGTPKQVDKLIDIVSDIYLNSTFPAEELEKERGVVIEEINMYQDDPRSVVSDLFQSLAYGDQPAGWTIIGPKDVIKKLTRDEVMQYQKMHYVATGTLVIVSGNIDTRHVSNEIKKTFAGIATSRKHRKKKTVIKQTKPQVAVKYRKTDQSHLILGARSFNMFHKDYYAVLVLTGILGRGMSSRLFQKLREEMGAAYYVYAYNDVTTDTGMFQIGAGVTTERIHEIIRVILDEIKILTTELVPAAELNKVQEYLIGTAQLALESSDSFAQFYGFQSLLDREVISPRKRTARIRKVTAADVKRVAKKIFRNENLNLAVLGPYKSDTTFKKNLKIT